MFWQLKVSLKMGTFSDTQHTHPGISIFESPPPGCRRTRIIHGVLWLVVWGRGQPIAWGHWWVFIGRCQIQWGGPESRDNHSWSWELTHMILPRWLKKYQKRWSPAFLRSIICVDDISGSHSMFKLWTTWPFLKIDMRHRAYSDMRKNIRDMRFDHLSDKGHRHCIFVKFNM